MASTVIESYDLASCPPKDNHVIIFSHYKYKYPGMTREGTHEDMNRLCEFFNCLQYTVFPYQDLTYDEIMNKLQHHSSHGHAPLGSLILVVMTHGRKDGLLWAQDRDYKAHDIWELFIDCPSLKDKPKVFVFQACRGVKIERRMMTDAGPDQLEPLRLPHASGDVLLAYSTMEDYVSSRDTHKGSPYIQALCDELWKWPGGSVDLLTVLTKVTDRVVTEEVFTNPEEGQTPVFRSYLDRPVIHTQIISPGSHQRQTLAHQIAHGSPSTSIDVTSTDQAGGLLSMNVMNIITDAGKGVIPRDPQYPMTQGGCALIYFDQTHLQHSRDLQNVLLKCNFPVVARSEISHDGTFIDHITKDVESMNLKDHSCLLVAVLAKKNGDQIKVSGTSVLTREVTSPFIASKCTDLAHKPKIFFIVDQPIKNCSISHGGPPVTQDTKKKNILTDHSDFLIVQATGEDFVTQLNLQLQNCQQQNSASLVQAVTKVFRKTGLHFQQSNLESTLRKDVVFGSSGNKCAAATSQVADETNIAMDTTETIYQLPNTNFYGKEMEQEKFKQQLLNQKKRHVIDVAVTGLPGVGKSEFVRKCINEFENLRDEEIFWIHSSTSNTMNWTVQKFRKYHKIHGFHNLKEMMEVIYRKVKEDSRKRGEKKIIIVFDGVKKFEDIEQLLPPDTITNSFTVIVTSNYKSWKCDLELPLNYFTTDECFDYVQSTCTLVKSDQFKLVNLLWNCPSELQTAINSIEKKQNVPGCEELALEYIETLFQQSLRQEERRNKIVLNSVQKVERYFQSTVETLKAFYNKENIGMKILECTAILDEDKILTKIYIRVLNSNAENMHSALQFLKESSLLNYETHSGEQYIISEPLIRYFLNQKIENVTCLLKDLLRLFKEDIVTSTTLPTLRTGHLWRYIKNTLRCAISQEADFEDLPIVAIAAINTTNAPHHERLHVLKEIADKIEKIINTKEDILESDILLFLQYIQLLNNFKFIKKSLKSCNKFLLRVPEIWKKHPLVQRILYLKVQNLCSMNEWEEAWSMFIDIYASSKDHLGEDNKLTREYLVNMCITAVQLSEFEHDALSEVFLTYMGMWKERLCKIQTQQAATDELKAVCKVASTLREHKYYIAAISLCDNIYENIPEQLKKRQHVLGLQYLKTWSFNMKDISNTKWQECLQLYKTQVKVLGIEHEDTKSSIRDLGLAAAHMRGDSKQWTTYLQLWTERFTILKMREKDLKTLRDTLQSLLSLERSESNDQVISLCDHAMKHLPPSRCEEQHVLGMLHQKARSLRCIRQYKEAWSLWQDVYRRQEKALGMDHEDTRDTIREMFKTVATLEEEDIKSYFDLWSVRFQHVTQDQLELLVETIKKLDLHNIVVLGRDYNCSKRLSLCDWALSRIPGHLSEHRHTLQIMYWKGFSLYYLNRDKESWQLHQDLYWRQVRVLGMTHEDTVKTMKMMGWPAEDLEKRNIDRNPWRTYLGLLKQMLEQPYIDIKDMFSLVDRNGYINYRLQMYEVLVDVLKSSRGEKHHLTLRAQLGKAQVLRCLDRYDDAWQVYLDVCQLYGEQQQDRPDDQDKMLDIINNLKRKIIKESDSEW